MNRASVLLLGLVVGLTGCTGSKAEKGQNRAQIGEDGAPDADAFATIGMKTLPDNMGPVNISGVGLVYRLHPGTGSSAPAGTWRQILEHSLKKQGFSNLRELLDDPNHTTSLVLLSAVVPPGARKGEAVDVSVSLPDDSKTTSLKGGVLVACELVDYDSTENLKSLVHTGRAGAPNGTLLLGNVWAKADGPVVAGTFMPFTAAKPAESNTVSRIESKSLAEQSDSEPPTLKAGRVWGGGRVTKVRPYYFLLRPGDQTIRMALTVAERLNATFHATDEPNLKLAEAKTRELVVVHVPHVYRHNHHRFLLVARQVPIVPVAADSPYRRRLEDQLLDPATALVAAIKLEALGGDSRRALRVGLESTSPWVRFAAAESLAYLGHTDGAGELAKLAEDHPALRAHCLKALAASDDAAFTDRLVDLTASPDPALRYGAFIALRLADENNSAVRGQMLNGSMWVHRVAPGSLGMIHLTTSGRSEVVLFGDGLKFRGPFTLPVGSDFTMSMAATDGEAKLTRIVRINGELTVKELKCPADAHAVLETLAKLGGGHGEAVELLKRADSAQVLAAALMVDAIPRQMTVQQLAALARNDPALLRANVEVSRVGTLRTDLETAGIDITPEQDPSAKPADTAPRPPLSRQPGRIFGPKHQVESATPTDEQLAPVVPASETTPAEPAKPEEQQLSRRPGTLFPRK